MAESWGASSHSRASAAGFNRAGASSGQAISRRIRQGHTSRRTRRPIRRLRRAIADPAMPPIPPLYWRRKEPIGAIVLIGLGLLFLLGQLDMFHGRLFEFTWPLLLIGLGVWLIVRRIGESQGGSK